MSELPYTCEKERKREAYGRKSNDVSSTEKISWILASLMPISCRMKLKKAYVHMSVVWLVCVLFVVVGLNEFAYGLRFNIGPSVPLHQILRLKRSKGSFLDDVGAWYGKVGVCRGCILRVPARDDFDLLDR